MFAIRCGQPVEYLVGADGSAQATGASFKVKSTGQANNATGLASTDGLYMLEFVIDDISGLTGAQLGANATGFTIAFSWAMTCANDVIQGVFNFNPPPPGGQNVPLPAAFPLFAFAVGGLGLAGRWRSRRRANAA